MKRIATITAIVIFSIVIMSGCRYEADENYSVPEVSATAEPSSSENSEVSKMESGMTPDEYLLQYVNHIYSTDEIFDFYFADVNAPENYAVDLSFRVTDVHFDDKLSSNFDYLNDDDKRIMTLKSDETYCYYTVEITIGDRQVNKEINLGNLHLMAVGADETSDTPVSFVGNEEVYFYPCENYDSVHDGHTISVSKGETKTINFVNTIKKSLLKNEVYLDVDYLGSAIFNDTVNPHDLTDDQRKGVGVFKLQDGTGSESLIETSEEQSTNNAMYKNRWIYDSCKKIKIGELTNYKVVLYGEDGESIRASADMNYTVDSVYTVSKVDFDVSVHTISPSADAVDADGNIKDGYVGIVADITSLAGENNQNDFSPSRTDAMLLMFKKGDMCDVTMLYSCFPRNRSEKANMMPFSDYAIQPGETLHTKILYVIPEEYYNDDNELYILIDYSDGLNLSESEDEFKTYSDGFAIVDINELRK